MNDQKERIFLPIYNAIEKPFFTEIFILQKNTFYLHLFAFVHFKKTLFL